MKKYILSLLLFFLGITGTLQAQTIEKLPVPNVKTYPLRKNWCAAACAECVLKYNKTDIDQCKIMDDIRFDYPLVYGGNDFCCQPSNTSPHPCDKGIDLGYFYENPNLNNVLMRYGNNGNNILFSNVAEGVLNFINIQSQLGSFGQPIIARWNMWVGDLSAHAIVICGIKNGEIQYMDPGKGDLGTLLSYEKFKENGEHTWFGYIVLSSPYSGHCFNCKLDADKGEEEIDCGGSGCKPCYSPPPTGNCTDCKKNDDEKEIDCGGADCPPCEDVPQERVITKTAQLSSEVKALKKITAGGATTVASGETVSFITKEEGSIVLLPGFKVEEGSNFSTQRQEDLSGYARACPENLCATAWFPRSLTVRLGMGGTWFGFHDLLYAVKIEYEITDEQGRHIYSKTKEIANNGDVELWDCLFGALTFQGAVTYYLTCTIERCNGGKYTDGGAFVVTYEYQSLIEVLENLETPPQFSPLNLNDVPLNSATATPNFSIIPNPNLGAFQLETNFPLSAIGNLKITNLMGATVYETQNVVSNTVQLPRPTTGTFFVLMILKDGAVLTQKMVVR